MPQPLDEPKEIVERRRLAYAKVFFLGGASAHDLEVVEDDLATFCRAFETTHHEDPAVSKMLEGRREVFNRIREFGMLDFDTLFKRYHTKGRR